MTVPADVLEAACRAWFDAPNEEGKRLSSIPWDECHFFDKEPYRRRMAAALEKYNELVPKKEGTP